jgi:hypothetical protein
MAIPRAAPTAAPLTRMPVAAPASAAASHTRRLAKAKNAPSVKTNVQGSVWTDTMANALGNALNAKSDA